MTKHIELKAVNQGTALATGTLALPPLVIEGLEEFKGSFNGCACRLGLRPSRRCLRPMQNTFVASATTSRWPAGPSQGHDRQRGWLALRQGSHLAVAGASALIQRCQMHKGRNIVERLEPSHCVRLGQFDRRAG